MAQFGPYKAEIEAKGSLLFIAAQRRGGIVGSPERFFAGHESPFPFLLDEDRSVSKAYGVHKRLAMDGFDIAQPATFVIGKDGKVRYAFVGPDQFHRAKLELVVAELQRAAIS